MKEKELISEIESTEREILELFPEAKLINMVRDPRDILLSQKKRWKRFWRPEQKMLELSVRTWMNYHPISPSRLWNAAVSAAGRARNERQILSVRYEDIIKHDFLTCLFN